MDGPTVDAVGAGVYQGRMTTATGETTNARATGARR